MVKHLLSEKSSPSKSLADMFSFQFKQKLNAEWLTLLRDTWKCPKPPQWFICSRIYQLTPRCHYPKMVLTITVIELNESSVTQCTVIRMLQLSIHGRNHHSDWAEWEHCPPKYYVTPVVRMLQLSIHGRNLYGDWAEWDHCEPVCHVTPGIGKLSDAHLIGNEANKVFTSMHSMKFGWFEHAGQKPNIYMVPLPHVLILLVMLFCLLFTENTYFFQNYQISQCDQCDG